MAHPQIAELRVEINKDAYPELHESIAKINKRLRSERLRHLATLGLMIETGKYQSGPQVFAKVESHLTVENGVVAAGEELKVEAEKIHIRSDDFKDFES